MTSTTKPNETGFRRLLRLKRVAAHAADLLEREAQAMYECHTFDGDWGEHHAGKQDHDDFIKTASDLRNLVGC